MAGTKKKPVFVETDRERLLRQPYPMPIFEVLTTVEIYIGAGWKKGSVVESCESSCVVRFAVGGGGACCYDARNIRRFPS